MSVRPDGYTVWCDGAGDADEDWCSEWTAQGERTKRDAARHAKAEGWERARRDGRLVDLCPLHRSHNPATGSYQNGSGGTSYYWSKEGTGDADTS